MRSHSHNKTSFIQEKLVRENNVLRMLKEARLPIIQERVLLGNQSFFKKRIIAHYLLRYQKGATFFLIAHAWYITINYLFTQTLSLIEVRSSDKNQIC